MTDVNHIVELRLGNKITVHVNDSPFAVLLGEDNIFVYCYILEFRFDDEFASLVDATGFTVKPDFCQTVFFKNAMSCKHRLDEHPSCTVNNSPFVVCFNKYDVFV